MSQLDTIQEDIKEIKEALLGNKYHEGIVKRLDKLEVYKEKAKKIIWMGLGGVAVVTTIINYLLK